MYVLDDQGTPGKVVPVVEPLEVRLLSVEDESDRFDDVSLPAYQLRDFVPRCW